MRGEFDELIGPLLKREGGFVNHKADRGGATNMGITQGNYDRWRNAQNLPRQSVQLLTHDEAVKIYFAEYWLAARCGDIPMLVREIHFDAAVNHGPGRAIKLLQQACGLPPDQVDGIYGRMTRAAVTAMPPDLLHARYLAARYRFYGDIIQRDRSQLSFIAGWMARMEDFS